MLRTHSAGLRCPARSLVLCLLLAAGLSLAHGQAHPEAGAGPALAAGLGVSYVAPRDLVDLVNATAGGTGRVAQFTAFGEFFGAFSLPVSTDWILKFEYAYLTGSYSVSSLYGATDFNVTAHCPSVIVQYVIAERGVYDLKCGIGGGYHFGGVAERLQSLEYTYTGKGPGLVGELEGNTAFGDHLFAFLGVNLRWSSIGALANSAGVSPGHAAGGGGTTLAFFGAGARLGMSYHF
jgi:hypothetical protein